MHLLCYYAKQGMFVYTLVTPSLTLALRAARMDMRGSVIQEVRRWARNWFSSMGML